MGFPMTTASIKASAEDHGVPPREVVPVSTRFAS
jgi:hypothetical protein